MLDSSNTASAGDAASCEVSNSDMVMRVDTDHLSDQSILDGFDRTKSRALTVQYNYL